MRLKYGYRLSTDIKSGRTPDPMTGISGTKIKYIFDGTKLLAERHETNGEVKYLNFLYDAAGLAGFIDERNNTPMTYTVITDTFGTVHQIRDILNRRVASYEYGPWGECTVTAYKTDGSIDINPSSDHIANTFPIRWKGYYWDNAVQFYYIGGSWYDPLIGRFL